MLCKYQVLIYELSELVKSFKITNMKYCNFCHKENVQYMVFCAIIIIIIIILCMQLEFFTCLSRWTTEGKYDIAMYLHNSIF